jgi:hypothetical protein
MKDTELVSPRLPPALVSAVRISPGGTVAVVGQRLDDEGDPARAVAFVAHLLVGGVVFPARPALDGAFHRVLGHVGVTGGDHGGPETRIGVRVGQACLGRDRQLADDLGEDLGALRVLRALAIHDVLEL